MVLLDSGEVYTFGKHQEGQLGRQKLEADDDESWFMVPQPVVGVGARCKASWIGARGNQTFIVVDELLVSKSSLSNCTVFANTEMIGKLCIYCVEVLPVDVSLALGSMSEGCVSHRAHPSHNGRAGKAKHSDDQQRGNESKEVSTNTVSCPRSKH